MWLKMKREFNFVKLLKNLPYHFNPRDMESADEEMAAVSAWCMSTGSIPN